MVRGPMPWDCDKVSPPDDARPDVFVIGDSISSNYVPYIRQALPAYDVLEAPCNGGNTRFGVHRIQDWMGARARYEVVTFNHGMWDVSDNGMYVPIEEYKENLRYIGGIIKTKTDHPYFVLTTYTPSNQKLRNNHVVVAYNAAATEVMGDLGIPVIDLYTPSIGFERINHALGDDVHYTEQGGYDLAQIILPVIGL